MGKGDIEYRVIQNFASPSRAENRQASAKPTISPSKGPVKIYRVPRPGFGKNLPEKKSSPPFF